MSFTGQINFGYPITSQNIITNVPDNAVLPLSIGSSLQGNVLGVTFETLKSQISPPSVIGINGTSLYSTNPLAGPVGPLDNIAFGTEAGLNATNAERSNFLGAWSGKGATNSYNCNFIGMQAGWNATGVGGSNFFGANAGASAVDSYGANFIGGGAGYLSAGSQYSNFIGPMAGYNAPGNYNSNFIGFSTGHNASNAYNSNFIGAEAGYGTTNANNSTFIGNQAGMNSTGNNVNAFGKQAHKGGSLSGQTVFANATLPSYVNRAAATTAITIPNGAVAGSTYLYYNQTTFAVEAVRL